MAENGRLQTPPILKENSTACIGPTRKKMPPARFMGADAETGHRAIMGLADQYKRRAAECVRMAERTDNAEDKALLLQMAQTWMRLAEKAEDSHNEK
jgi:putative IMPACT (imprinted ancient) family translation regulator